MSDPKVAAKQPAMVKLEAGKTYAWCACGLSQGQPLCDGAHKTTEFRPLVWKAEEAKDFWLCQCKHTQNPPYCDGSHRAI
jgi:CDGSH-type Zn-finger protein